jgi:type I restriction enzyme R subunit
MFYDNCGEDVDLSIKLDHVVRQNKQDGFKTNKVKQKRIKSALYRVLNDDTEVERVFKLIMAQEEY